MKKTLVFLALFVTMTISCFGQDFDVTRLNIKDIEKVRTYLRDNIESLDPIEGIYSVSINRYTEDRTWGDRRSSYSYECVIVRHGTGFYMKKLSQEDGYENVYNADIHRIGESNIYNIKIEYSSGQTTDPSRRIADSRIELSSLFAFQFEGCRHSRNLHLK